MNRRSFLATAAATMGLASAARTAAGFEVTRSDTEWRAMLNDLEYKVMRKHGTERAFTSPLHAEKRAGTYLCRGCDLPLYSSADKFDSGTGWPSFTRAKPDAVGTSTDRRFFMTRTEVHCRRCGSHLGHIFKDGPPPTNTRHCINGVSLKFAAA
ncbi:peptide-methionine (R)-S-oxide reductase MsrB [Thalassococcus sp. CAU 1522]|uniref:Peptide-methionine (R)-S-oxide reductase MsrB n=1 Tax=Thalassococcus arenae TaxID=2851652 RepID=A0ABS6NBD6_9RHOB|nr:peptide-methionine (R)-S-oxide reductase MsrB [Thalassococcus arenae]MBV2361293.1 peptide-methionine (R)-S-oxide reductase MsrB [Thalassococcus arenae]